MKKYIKIYIILLTAAISLGTYTYIKSCSGGLYDPDAETHNLITQELIGETPYHPYLFAANSYLYGDNEPNTDGTLNAEEWSAYLMTKITPSDLSFFTDRRYNIFNAVTYFETGKFAKREPDDSYYNYDSDSSILSNTIYKVILANKDKKTLYYINTISAIESVLSPDYWGYAPPDTHKLDSIYNSIKSISLKQKLPQFLKTRYTFLLCKLSFYTDKFDRFYPALQSLKKLTAKSILLTWCRGYNASFILRRGQADSASYEYSRIFVECPEIMHTAFRSFFWCKEKHHSYGAYGLSSSWQGDNTSQINFQQYADFGTVQKLFKTPKERADYFGLYINRSYIPVCTDFMEMIIRDDPANEWVDVNLMRGIAQLEFYNSLSYKDTNMSNDLTEFQNFIVRHAYDKELKRPWLWLLGAGYLSYVNGEYAQAVMYYKEAEKLNTNDAAFQNQVKLLLPLAYMKSQTVITIKEEREALNYLKKLESVTNVQHKDDIKDELLNMFIDKYTKQHDAAKGMGIKNIYYNIDNLINHPRDLNLDSIIKFMETPSVKPYDNICKLLSKYSTSQLRITKASVLIGQHQWRAAHAEIELAGDLYTADGDAFVNIDIERTNNAGIKTQRRDYCKKMLELQEKINNNKATADEILNYANGLYNITYWGNVTSLSEYRYTTCFNYYSDFAKLYEYPMFACESAEKYYLMAASIAKDIEFQTKCYFSAAICEQNSYYINTDYSNDNEAGLKIKYRTYFKILKQQYRNTKYYTDALKTCSYLDAFDKMN